MHQHRDLRGRCSWNVSSGSNMAGLLFAGTGKQVIENGYRVVGPSWANPYHRAISNPSGRWNLDKTRELVDRLGSWPTTDQLHTHQHVFEQPRGKGETRYMGYDQSSITNVQFHIWPTLSALPYSRSPRIWETPSREVIGVSKNCSLDCRDLQLLK